MPNRVSVSSADFIRNVGYWQNEAMRNPISITHHGRERLILTTPDQFLPQGSADPVDTEAMLAPFRITQAALFENMDEAYLELNETLEITIANRAVENISMRSQEQLLGAKVFDTLPEPFGSIVADRARGVLRSRKPSSFEAGAPGGLTFTGRLVPLGSNVAALLRNSSQEEELRRERDELLSLRQAFAEHELVTLVRIDQRARISEAGAVFCKWLEFTRDELQGHRLADLVDAPQRREITAVVEQILRDGGRMRMHVGILRKNGGKLPTAMSLAATKRDGLITGATCVFVGLSGEDSAAAA